MNGDFLPWLIPGGFCFLYAAMFVVWIVLAIWVYKDAQKRGIENPVLWFIVVLVGGIIGLVIYLVIREGGLGFGKQQAPPPCRFCGGTLTYISQYQRWYCYNCRKYL